MVRSVNAKAIWQESRSTPVTALVPSKEATTFPLASNSTAVAKNCVPELPPLLVNFAMTGGYRCWPVCVWLGGWTARTVQAMLPGDTQGDVNSGMKRRCRSSFLWRYETRAGMLELY